MLLWASLTDVFSLSSNCKNLSGWFPFLRELLFSKVVPSLNHAPSQPSETLDQKNFKNSIIPLQSSHRRVYMKTHICSVQICLLRVSWIPCSTTLSATKFIFSTIFLSHVVYILHLPLFVWKSHPAKHIGLLLHSNTYVLHSCGDQTQISGM